MSDLNKIYENMILEGEESNIKETIKKSHINWKKLTPSESNIINSVDRYIFDVNHIKSEHDLDYTPIGYMFKLLYNVDDNEAIDFYGGFIESFDDINQGDINYTADASFQKPPKGVVRGKSVYYLDLNNRFFYNIK
jgi:hypothetical protein